MLQVFPKLADETTVEGSKAMKAIIVLLGVFGALIASRTGLVDTKAIEDWAPRPVYVQPHAPSWHDFDQGDLIGEDDD